MDHNHSKRTIHAPHRSSKDTVCSNPHSLEHGCKPLMLHVHFVDHVTKGLVLR
ncbi:hypothetical protein F751_5925 [Auxenochlorella protothecoides]|uniref:Uncharacterized protein n=1 Tax=Auxenochlorella protothecoides TaxID=3075 RepID=A0A087SQ14_AUXPR|nr:hypothetical protein F751_5925 [Auxenochlorella protothecoides]KFM27818.1 hypothetical protein F751_5925 [Auxenochlorella protothecoides]